MWLFLMTIIATLFSSTLNRHTSVPFKDLKQIWSTTFTEDNKFTVLDNSDQTSGGTDHLNKGYTL